MNVQDPERMARELLAAEYERDEKTGSAEHIRTQPLLPNKARAVRAIVAALRQQPAPVDLEQFREAVECWHDAALPANDVEAERKAKAKRLLSIIDNAGKVEHIIENDVPVWELIRIAESCGAKKDEDDNGAWWTLDLNAFYALEAKMSGAVNAMRYAEAHQPAPVVDDAAKHWHDLYRKECRLRQDDAARYGQKIEDLEAAPVVDDAMVERALNAKAGNWPVWQLFSCEDEAREIMCIALTAAYAPNCGARTMRLDDALADTQRAIIEAAERRGYERAKAEDVVVDDAMVERALVAARDASDARLPRYSVVRAILIAALARAQVAA